MSAFLASSRGRRAAAALAGLGLAVSLPTWLGFLGGVVLAYVLDRVLARLEPASVRERRDRIVADLPLAADLLAACLRAGRPLDAAVDAVGRGVAGPLGGELRLVAGALRLGAGERTAWAGFLDEPALAAFGRAMVRAWESGAPLAGTLDRIAEDTRRRRRAVAEERARSVGVKAAAPLGLCFLPAFLLVGVVPVIISAVSDLLA